MSNVGIMPKRRKSRIVKPLGADCNAEQLATRKLVEPYKPHPLEDYVDVTERTKRQRQSMILTCVIRRE
jgi:hypothetical protein